MIMIQNVESDLCMSVTIIILYHIYFSSFFSPQQHGNRKGFSSHIPKLKSKLIKQKF